MLGLDALENIELAYDPPGPLLDLYSRELKTCTHKNLYMNVRGSIFHNSQNMKYPIYHLMNRLTKYDVSIQWNLIQP